MINAEFRTALVNGKPTRQWRDKDSKYDEWKDVAGEPDREKNERCELTQDLFDSSIGG